MTVRTAIHRPVPAGALPDFTPVPRKIQRHDGWTPMRQRAFIEALADTGCVAIAARMVNMSQASVYQLRRQPGAESFRAAIDAAQTLGLQVVKDEAFHRAMVGELIPVFVGGKLMGFRRKKNDRILMFILRHYGQDASGRRTTINYFSTRATAGAAAGAPSGRQPTRSGALTSARDAEPCRPTTGEAVSIDVTNSVRDGGSALAAADTSAIASAKAEASTTTVKTVITGNNAPTQLAADESAANALNAFEGVELDPEAQAEIHRALTQCAERRRALEQDPENDPERLYIGAAETAGYLGQLESGVEGDWVEYRSGACPEQGRRGEHLWENLGEGGEAERIDRVLAGIAERKAAMTPEQVASEQAEHEVEVQRMRAQWALPAPTEPDPDDPRLDWRNWNDDGYVEPPAEGSEGEPPSPARGCDPSGGRVHGEGEGDADAPISPRTGRPLKRYKKRQLKPPFTAPDEVRKAQAVATVEAERREAAEAEAERRKRRKS